MLIFDSDQSFAKMSISTKETQVNSDVSPLLASIVYPLGQHLVLPFYFKSLEVIGQENLPQQGPIILAPTHRSRWDAIMIPYATGRYITGRDLRFMATVDEMKGLQGWFIRHLGGFAINQKHPTISTIRYGVELLHQGEMLVIFPEGNIFQDDQVHPLKLGLGRLAIQAETSHDNLGIKIVPISVRYNPIIPGRGSSVKIKIASPLSVADYCQGSPKKDAQHLIQDLQLALNQIDQQEGL
ncbi:MAG TPA: 1-acyl-sn-glycerol-3-phosphate acyltransferase [Oscillatoriales bacterium UBA8482]|nr:MAG: 1-acyl-sn-glycerol-3-phosphate acyltransferase [Oscillatoriales cyanobacterium CG2_30_40_61]HBW58117.1 1-acyl-sn-glycerol-3-phosphate acyltransferase [Oscillatoriales bacterium UBA8482]